MGTKWPLLAALVVCMFVPVVFADEPKPTGEQQTMKAERKKAAHRRRRIMFNNDGNDVVYELKNATAEELLNARTTPLLGSQVDAIFYCTWCSGYSYFTHRTAAGEIFTSTANPEHPDNKSGGFSRNKVADFLKQGTDALQIMVDFCRKNNIDIFWSFRMNDTHDAWGSWYGDLLFPQLKKDHPDWLTGSKTNRPKHGGWSAADFGRPEIRDLTVKFIAEVCENYDVDGIEMDFCRHLMYFKKVAWGEHAGPDELAQMTDMVRRVRQTADAAALKRRKPMLVAVRVPDSVGYCKAMGLDVEAWLREDLVDILSVSDYFRLNPWRVSVELGSKYGVPVYAGISESRVTPDVSKLRNSPQSYRARALNAWNSGVAGVYMFNFFNPRSPLWRELGDPQTLDRLDKVYFVSVRGAKGSANPDFWLRAGAGFRTRTLLSPDSPMPLKPNKKTTVPIMISDDVSRAKSEGAPVRVTLRMLLAKLADPADVSVALNGKSLAGGALVKEWLEYALPPELVAKGENRFEIQARQDAVLQDLCVHVRYSDK